jgi:hypothetical protein
MDFAWDRSTCELKARRTVTTDTVRVFVQATVTQAGGDGPGSSAGGKLGDAVTAALVPVLSGPWSVTGATREEDESGMERVRLVATVRVPEQQAVGLTERLRRASRPGMRLELQRIEYRPPRAKIDAALRELRQEIYREARREAEVLNAELPSDTMPWRVGTVQITEQVAPRAEQFRGAAAAAYAMSRHMSSGGYKSGGSRLEEGSEVEPAPEAGIQVEVTAKVTLNRLALPLEAFFRAARRPE